MITYILMAITVVTSFLAWSNRALMARLIMNPYKVEKQNQYYRFITSGLIHNDHMHLLLNMFSFYFFGLAIERIFKGLFGETEGGIYFIALYLLGLVVSDIPSYLKHKHQPGYNSLGASGAVSAVIGVFIILEPLNLICIYIALCLPGFIMGALYIAFSYYQGRKKNSHDNINHDAHLYGALFGFIFCIVLYPSSVPQFIDQISNWPFLQKIF